MIDRFGQFLGTVTKCLIMRLTLILSLMAIVFIECSIILYCISSRPDQCVTKQKEITADVSVLAKLFEKFMIASAEAQRELAPTGGG